MVLSQEPPKLQWIEFFAGKAEATRMFKEGFRTARLDLQYMSAKPGSMNPCDLLSDAGFAFQGMKPLSIFGMFLVYGNA